MEQDVCSGEAAVSLKASVLSASGTRLVEEVELLDVRRCRRDGRAGGAETGRDVFRLDDCNDGDGAVVVSSTGINDVSEASDCSGRKPVTACKAFNGTVALFL